MSCITRKVKLKEWASFSLPDDVSAALIKIILWGTGPFFSILKVVIKLTLLPFPICLSVILYIYLTLFVFKNVSTPSNQNITTIIFYLVILLKEIILTNTFVFQNKNDQSSILTHHSLSPTILNVLRQLV